MCVLGRENHPRAGYRWVLTLTRGAVLWVRVEGPCDAHSPASIVSPVVRAAYAGGQERVCIGHMKAVSSAWNAFVRWLW